MQAKTPNKAQGKKIVCVHLLNDYSDSPMVLSMVVKGLKAKGYDIDFFTSKGGEGFLSNLPVNHFSFPYKRFGNLYITLISFFISQILLFFKLLKYRKENVQFYINTLLPCGAAWAGYLMNKPVLYHIHKTSIRPPIFKRFLKFIATKTASKAIYVSNHLIQTEALQASHINNRLIYKALSPNFIAKVRQFEQAEARVQFGDLANHWVIPQSSLPKGMRSNKDDATYSFTVLMLCSLHLYKGVDSFVQVAQQITHIQFDLVLNASNKQIEDYFAHTIIPDNLTLYPSQSNVHSFYQRASLVMNLSKPNSWVDTFDLTLLEAMEYGIPVICPPVGGSAEIVSNGVEGFHVDSRKIASIASRVLKLYDNPTLHNQFAKAAKRKAQQFSDTHMIQKIINLLNA